ncbi:MULE transposase domain [Sesbania bispinosa]|nr:MULE transposase domain [Sesbania bispinosa]
MSMFEENETSMGLDDITSQQGDDYNGSRGPCDDAIGFDEGEEFLSEESVQDDCFEEVIMMDDFNDIKKFDMKNISEDDLRKYDFADLDVAHKFYRWYGRSNGFSVRKSNVVSNRGYQKIGFLKKDIYNEIGKQRQQQASDASGALEYLRQLRLKDNLMFYKHITDEDGRLRHLFWCDGESQMNYQVFGDVLAFDATYRKNKYMCPVVIFSGVNNHNQTTVFASAIVSDETEQTYVWLLEQLAQVMKGKAPSSVITDGDLAMGNAIRKVFPNAHHRLCAWHLLRNATSNVGIPDFMTYFKRWTKSAKASIRGTYIDGSCYWDSHLIARYVTLLELCRELSELASHDDDDYNHIVNLVTNELHKLRRKNRAACVIDNNASQNMHGNLRDPAPVRSKGCGPTTAATSTRCRRGRHCGICGVSGHNRRSCPIGRQNVEMTPSTSRHPFVGEDEGSFYHNNNLNSGLDSSQLHEQPHMFAYSTSQDVDGGQ